MVQGSSALLEAPVCRLSLSGTSGSGILAGGTAGSAGSVGSFCSKFLSGLGGSGFAPGVFHRRTVGFPLQSPSELLSFCAWGVQSSLQDTSLRHQPFHILLSKLVRDSARRMGL